jgi:hypothetical protein
MFAPPPVGVKLWTATSQAALIYASGLFNSLTTIGLSPIIEQNDKLTGEQVVIIVGAKP